MYAIGLDFGTNSVRAIVASTADGKMVGSAVFNYPHGDMGVVTDRRDPNVARQHPADYLAGIEATISEALKPSGVAYAALPQVAYGL
jgi:L-ribulokinase